MKLSFLPGDLHLEQDQDRFLITKAGQEILNTNSKRVALAKFRSLKTEMEKQFPMHEQTAEERAEVLRSEIDAAATQPHSVAQIRDSAVARLSPSAMGEVKKALELYYAEVESSDLRQSSQATYIDMANNFVRWLRGEFQPGSRKEPYRTTARKSSKSQ